MRVLADRNSARTRLGFQRGMHARRMRRRAAVDCRIFDRIVSVIEPGHRVCLGSHLAQLIQVPAQGMVAQPARHWRQVVCGVIGISRGRKLLDCLVFGL